jgi:LmbE family N-acetylglucosaminyl deacetylase
MDLLDRTLVLVAHGDDETAACGALLQRMAEPVVVLATDGAPRDRYFWGAYGSRLRYARVREEEIRRALGVIGVENIEFLPELSGDSEMFVDQELYRHLPSAIQMVSGLVSRYRVTALLSLAYEGGHPDHDACSFICSVVAQQHRLPAWEIPLYHRCSSNRLLVQQQFLADRGDTVTLTPTPEELQAKREMFAAYASQGHVLAEFDIAVERRRPLASYDYSQPPHGGTLNYEFWGWPMRGCDLCRAFDSYLRGTQAQGSSV